VEWARSDSWQAAPTGDRTIPLSDFKPYRLSSPIKLQIAFKSSAHAELLAMLPGVERTDGHTIVFTARDMVEAAKFLTVVMDYGSYQ